MVSPTTTPRQAPTQIASRLPPNQTTPSPSRQAPTQIASRPPPSQATPSPSRQAPTQIASRPPLNQTTPSPSMSQSPSRNEAALRKSRKQITSRRHRSPYKKPVPSKTYREMMEEARRKRGEIASGSGVLRRTPGQGKSVAVVMRKTNS